MRLKIVSCFLSLGVLIPILAGAQSPNDVVEEAVGMLDEALNERRDELTASSDARYALINEILLPRFDRRYAAQLALGKHWRSATDEQKDAFVEEFYTSLLRRYADGLLKFDQRRIEMMPYRGDDTKKITKVKTKVTLDDGTEVPVDYALANRGSGWKMIDVIIEGISYLQTTKKELNEEIRRSSLDDVLARIKRENSSDTENG